MIEMQNDVIRRTQYDTATREAAKDSFSYSMHQTMEEKLSAMHAKQARPKRKIPWFTIITILTTIPFFMGSGIPSIGGVSGGVNETQIQQAISTMKSLAPNENAKVSIQIGDKVIEREISISDLESMQ